VFPEATPILRNRTVVQSFATLVSRLIQTGKQKGLEEKLRRFFESFMEELSRQVTLGHQATDLDYLTFQKTINANIRRSSQIRHGIILRKLLSYDPTFIDIFGVTVIAECAIEKSLTDCGVRIRGLVEQRNEEYARDKGEDLFKPTNKTANALTNIGCHIKNYAEYKDWIDRLYFLFWESVGTRLQDNWPKSFLDVNTLRTAEQHDLDHGKKSKTKKKRIKIGECFKKYSGMTTPSTLDPEKFSVVQSKLLSEIEKDLHTLKWK
jgi:hypothetical protein